MKAVSAFDKCGCDTYTVFGSTMTNTDERLVACGLPLPASQKINT
jgi:hypothetical protein